MDNNWNVSTAVIDTFIEEAYEGYTTSLLEVSVLALITYAALSKLPEEVEHIWFKPFSLPTFLYIFARYTFLIYVGLNFSLNFTPLGRSCNLIANAANPIAILSDIGVQGISGLLIARAYSLCKGTKSLTMALASCFLVQLIIILYGIIASPGCITRSAFHAACFVPSALTDIVIVNPSLSVEDNSLFLGQSIIDVITGILIFGICMWKVWGTWKSKRQAGIQSNNSLVSILLKQSILRCCFVIIFSITHVILLTIDVHSSMPFISENFDILSDALSSILVAGFTLDLRRLNSAKIMAASNISLPTLRFSNVLQNAHQSILVEMATPEEEEEGGNHGHGHDGISGSANDIEIQPVQG